MPIDDRHHSASLSAPTRLKNPYRALVQFVNLAPGPGLWS